MLVHTTHPIGSFRHQKCVICFFWFGLHSVISWEQKITTANTGHIQTSKTSEKPLGTWNLSRIRSAFSVYGLAGVIILICEAFTLCSHNIVRSYVFSSTIYYFCIRVFTSLQTNAAWSAWIKHITVHDWTVLRNDLSIYSKINLCREKIEILLKANKPHSLRLLFV